MNSPKHSNTHKFHRNFAIIIGINKYANEKDELKAAANDAKRLAVFLGNEERKKQRGGNEWYQVLLLTDEATTHEKITEVFKNLEEEKIYFPGQTIKYHDKGENKDKTIEVPKEKPVTLQKNDRLLVYFAGHGRLSEGLHLQLVCQDDKDFSAEYLQQKILMKLPCDHKLLILDCCYSGAARESSQKQQPLYRAPGNGNKTYNEDFIWLQRPTFTMITSGGYTQVPDGGALNPEHSHFSDVLLEALDDGIFVDKKVDSNNDNILTIEEIFNYIKGDTRVIKYQNPNLVPSEDSTINSTDPGQYFFLLEKFDPNVLKSIGNLDKPYKGLFAYEEEDRPIFCGQDELVDELFKRVNKDNQNLTIVTGASGSGKSSIVKAGLIPLLKNSHTSTTGFEQSDESNQAKQWTILAVMRPGESPLAALAKTILPIYDNNLLDEINTKIKKLPSFVSNQNLQINDKVNNKIKNMSLLINDFDELTKKCGDNQQKKEQLEKLKYEADKKLNEIALNFNQDLQQEINSLIKLIKKWSKTININNAHILLFIDQFEELITLSQSPEKEIFLNLIVQLVKESENLHIVLTVRSDFEIYFRDSSKTSDYSNSISQYWNAATRLVVEEMNSTQLRQAIMIPARRFIDAQKRMLGFESEQLVSDIIDDVRGMPGGLALLSFTLDELYKMASEDADKNKKNTIIIEEKDYKKLGRVSGALTKRATEVYNNLSQAIQLPEYDKKFTKKYEQEYKDKGKGKLIPAEDESAGEVRQAMMKQLILRMVTTQGGKLAKRPVPISELQYPNWRSRYKNSTYRMCQVIDQLIKERLIVSNSYESNKGNNKEEICYVEPAHDALILYWDKLHKKNDTEQQQEQNNQVQEQGWLEEYKDNLDLRDRLINDVQKWQAREQESKKRQLKNLRKCNKYQKPMVDLYEKLVECRLKIKGFIDSIIEFEIRNKLGQRIKNFYLKLTLFLLKLIGIILGIILISIGLLFIISVVGFPYDESPLVAILILLLLVLLGLFITFLGLFFISRKLAFKSLRFLVISIFFNLIIRCYRLFRK